MANQGSTPSPSAPADRAFDELAAVVGPEHVIQAPEELRRASTATFATTSRVLAIVRPASVEEVIGCVRAAQRTRVSLWPVSGGANWGYGSRVPAGSDAVLLDLGRMNRILDFDEALAYVTVEPGVTFSQLYAFLEDRGSGLFMSATGAPPESSLVGNAVERGIGKGPYGDRFAATCALQVVLPDGRVLETGFARYPGAKIAPLTRWGVGPAIDGIFSQSNFGIVTRMTVWLAPRPEHFQTFFYHIDDDRRLGPLVEALRDLRLRGAVRTPILLANDYRWISFARQYPWTETAGVTPLPAEIRMRMRREIRRGAWSGDGALYSNSRAQARADRDVVARALRPRVDRFEFWNERRATIARTIAGVAAKITGRDIRPLLDLAFRKSIYRGIPMPRTLETTYWRKKTPPGGRLHPDDDRCGVIWYSPVVPATATDARAAADIIQRTSAEHGFEPNIGFNFVSERSMDLTGGILYDRDVAGEDERAMVCHDALMERLMAAGYYPYRTGTHSIGKIPRGDGALADVLEAWKSAVDPNGILAPGKVVGSG